MIRLIKKHFQFQRLYTTFFEWSNVTIFFELNWTRVLESPKYIITSIITHHLLKKCKDYLRFDVLSALLVFLIKWCQLHCYDNCRNEQQHRQEQSYPKAVLKQIKWYPQIHTNGFSNLIIVSRGWGINKVV